MRTDQEIIQQTNELARILYRLRGYTVNEGYRFDKATHPHEVEAWRGACEAQILLTDTDPQDALDEIEENNQDHPRSPMSTLQQTFDFFHRADGCELGTSPCSPLVVHCKRAKYDVYIGRPSKWGNPFEIGKDGDRETVIRKYRQWVVMQPHLMAELPELRGKVLGCWCAPKPCHGDVLVSLANTKDQAPVGLPASACSTLLKNE